MDIVGYKAKDKDDLGGDDAKCKQWVVQCRQAHSLTPQVTQSHQLHCSDIELQHIVKEEVQQQEGEDVSFNLGRRAVAAETESDCNITKSPLSAASHKLLASCWNRNNDFYL